MAELTATSCLTPLQWCWPFNQPVDTNIYRDYMTVVKTPMDFGSVKKNIDRGELGVAGDFHDFHG